MKRFQVYIDLCENLDQLVETLNELEYVTHDIGTLDEFIDLTSLPVFGDSDIANPDGIYSWDETRILVAVNHKWVLESRY